MRKIIVTAILLLVFGTVWMLYLEYDNRRFIENLSQPPVPVTQTVSPAEAPVTSETSETMAHVTSPLETASETEVADMSTAHTHVHPQTHTEENSQIESTDFLSEAPIFENDFKDVDESPPHRSAKQFLMEELGRSEAEIERRKPLMRELNRLVWSKPENWAKGRPWEVGFTFDVWTIKMLTSGAPWQAIHRSLLIRQCQSSPQGCGTRSCPQTQPTPQTIDDDILKFTSVSGRSCCYVLEQLEKKGMRLSFANRTFAARCYRGSGFLPFKSRLWSLSIGGFSFFLTKHHVHQAAKNDCLYQHRCVGFLALWVLDDARRTDSLTEAETYPPKDWHKTKDPELRAEYLYAQLIKQFGDTPEVQVIGDYELKAAQGIPPTLGEYIEFLEAHVYLWPNDKTLSTLKEMRRIRAENEK